MSWPYKSDPSASTVASTCPPSWAWITSVQVAPASVDRSVRDCWSVSPKKAHSAWRVVLGEHLVLDEVHDTVQLREAVRRQDQVVAQRAPVGPGDAVVRGSRQE